MAQKYAIQVENLHKAYGKVKVLEGVTFNVKAGTIVALLGPNGAGKTTTVRILSTLLQPDSGEVRVGGYDVVKDADEVRSVIGLTGQYAAVDEYLSGKENLEMMGRLYRLSKQDTKRRTEELLEQFDLVKAAGRNVKTYSGGMRRRLDLAASLIASPPIIFLDEPTTGLDPRSRMAMWNIIQKLVDNGTTILLTTQYLDEADQLADNIVVIDNGTVIAEGTADELKQRVGSERLELTFEAASDYKKAHTLMKNETMQTDDQHRKISIANDGGAHSVKEWLVKLENEGVGVEAISLHKPTLDDVFMELTGRQATAQVGEEKEEE